MYMAIIGMALIAVPKSIVRALVWFMMVVIGWFLAVVETAFADAWASFGNGQITVNADGDGFGDCVSIYANNDSVFVSDAVNTPSLMADDASEVTAILINGDSGGDAIDLSDVTQGNGFTGMSGTAVTIASGSGNDTVSGSDFGDCIVGGANDDELSGNGGNDIIEGGVGGDFIQGGIGDDNLYHNDAAAGTAMDGSFDDIWGNSIFNQTPQAGDVITANTDFNEDFDRVNGV